ncbi:hypothetical protein MMC20_002913 [Loxospora ochrophaea]|nr:hypothetical protein [Loxospora ochrophaea]
MSNFLGLLHRRCTQNIVNYSPSDTIETDQDGTGPIESSSNPDSAQNFQQQQDGCGGFEGGFTLGAGAIAGIVIGTLLLLLFIIIFCACWKRRRAAARNMMGIEELDNRRSLGDRLRAVMNVFTGHHAGAHEDATPPVYENENNKSG